MESTRPTLLERVRDPRDTAAWREFDRLYSPLIFRYVVRQGVRNADAEELAQDCMKDLAKLLPRFVYSPQKGRFKAYLKTLVDHRVARFRRRVKPALTSRSRLERVVATTGSNADWDGLWMREHLLHCLRALESKSTDVTVKAFRLYALDEWPIERVCRHLGLTPNQVYLAKSRMTRRLRAALRDQIGDIL